LNLGTTIVEVSHKSSTSNLSLKKVENAQKAWELLGLESIMDTKFCWA
jgi:hypothetical protein